MFSRLLIANRGEIACRVIRTARAMGIHTIAVYSDADGDAVHTAMADEAVAIGPAPAAHSYLSAEAIIEAARETGAQAVHPGYGFLSENADFARALDEAGIAFVGPGATAIEVMGDKIAAKRFAIESGVSTVPGHDGVIESDDAAATAAAEIGYPVMLKASAGGGGKGMRIANDEEELRREFSSAVNEANAAFGDGRVFVEKYVSEPRHIEIQVLADAHGNVIHLGERECSIQRRNQKVIEEAPSPLVDEAMREAMGAEAVALARAIGYVSAGTVEFIVDRDRNFYFLEMNTRLQVEHPVTELVTGLDLVEWMIRIAAGEQLAITQDDVRFEGWAIESRIYAEDPTRGFLPSIGRLVRYDPPPEGSAAGLTVRNDTGVEEGSTISVHYDPMIAKLCTHGPDRISAIDHMQRALDRFTIAGIEHNVGFLAAVMAHPRWREGRLATTFIADEYPDGFAGREADAAMEALLVAVAAVIDHIEMRRRPGSAAGGVAERVVVMDGGHHRVSVTSSGRTFEVHGASGTGVLETAWQPGRLLFAGAWEGNEFAVQVRRHGGSISLSCGGVRVDAAVRSPREAELLALMPERREADTSRMLRCPMPGVVVALSVETGQAVKAGEALCVVEAMKMENVLRAERDVTVSAVCVAPGDSLAVDAVIMEFA